ncbi:MAG: hypothetical protein PVH61_43425 [Candidatus Aminicenantes bacterium]|jgi:hypothetical protein
MKIKNNVFFKTLIILLFVPVIAIQSFPIIFANGSGGGYQTGEENLNGAANGMEALVIRGANEYLQAYADTLVFLRQMEMQPLQGIDYAGCRDILAGSLSHLDRAMETYRLLIRQAEATPYNTAVLMRLKDFDYKGFMERNGFDGVIIEKVKAQLLEGDITGFYRMIYSRMDQTRSLIAKVTGDVSQDKLPPVITLWQLNRMYFNTLRAGQFVAMVFDTIN